MGCGPSMYGEYGYDDFPHVYDWAELDAVQNEDELTLGYYYNRDFFGTDCAGCQIVNEALFAYGMENDDGIELILVNERTVMGVRPLALNRQPAVFFYDDETITYVVTSAADILELLEALENGTFNYEEVRGETYE